MNFRVCETKHKPEVAAMIGVVHALEDKGYWMHFDRPPICMLGYPQTKTKLLRTSSIQARSNASHTQTRHQMWKKRHLIANE